MLFNKITPILFVLLLLAFHIDQIKCVKTRSMSKKGKEPAGDDDQDKKPPGKKPPGEKPHGISKPQKSVKGKEKEKAMNEDDQTENFPSLEQLAKVGIKPEELKVDDETRKMLTKLAESCNSKMLKIPAYEPESIGKGKRIAKKKPAGKETLGVNKAPKKRRTSAKMKQIRMKYEMKMKMSKLRQELDEDLEERKKIAEKNRQEGTKEIEELSGLIKFKLLIAVRLREAREVDSESEVTGALAQALEEVKLIERQFRQRILMRQQQRDEQRQQLASNYGDPGAGPSMAPQSSSSLDGENNDEMTDSESD